MFLKMRTQTRAHDAGVTPFPISQCFVGLRISCIDANHECLYFQVSAAQIAPHADDRTAIFATQMSQIFYSQTSRLFPSATDPISSCYGDVFQKSLIALSFQIGSGWIWQDPSLSKYTFHGPISSFKLIILMGSVKRFFRKSAFRPFKVIQGHWFWYQFESAPHPYSTLISGVFRLDKIADVGVNSSKYRPTLSYAAVKLFAKYNLIPTYVITVPERYGQTDDILCHNRALRSIAW